MSLLAQNLKRSAELKLKCANDSRFTADFARMTDQVVKSYNNGGRLYVCGNGGSAADAQHIVAEFVSKLCRDRKPLPAEALTVDTSILTAIGNDYGFDKLFERQVIGKMSDKDVLLAITTSGESENICRALTAAKNIGANTIVFSGKNGGRAIKLCDFGVVVPSDNTAEIQEVHITLGHSLCQIVEEDVIFNKE